MVVRVEALETRLAKLDGVISDLEDFAAMDPAALSRSHRDMLALERSLQVGASLVFDIGSHILSAAYGVSAGEYEEIVGLLFQRGVLSAGLRGRLKGLGGFRNVLVHEYIDLDPDRVLDFLAKAPGEFDDFAHEIRDWLAGHTEPSPP
ncbi:MAG: DUF86 domain-containing protein [Thermoanaerobaculia bacterium]